MSSHERHPGHDLDSSEDIYLLALFDAMRESVGLFDHQGLFLYANPATERMHGIPRDQLVGRVLWELYPEAIASDFHQAFESVRASGALVSLEHYFGPWDRWFQTGVYALGQRIVVIATDITERKRAEARMAMLADDNARALVAERQARRAAEEAMQRTERLQRLTALLATALTAEQAAMAMATEGRLAMGAAAGAVWLLSAGGTELELVASAGADTSHLAGYHRFRADADLPACDALRTRAPVVLHSPEERLRRYPQLGDGTAAGYESWACIPLFAGERSQGVLLLSFAEPRVFLDEEQAFMAVLAQQCAQTIDRARLFESERAARAHAERVAEYTRSLQAMTSHLSRRLPAVEVAETILRETTTRLGGNSAAIWLLDHDRRQLEMLASVGYSGGSKTRLRALPLDASTPLADAVRNRREVWLRDVVEYGRAYPESLARGLPLAPSDCATACLPLAAEGHVIGGLALALPRAHDFDDDERTFLRVLADHCAQAIDRSRLIEQERATSAAHAETNLTLNAIISASPAAIMLVDLDGTVRLWNPAAERIFGWSAEQVLGRFLPSISDEVYEEFLGNLAIIGAGQPIVSMETRRRTRDRGMIDVGIWAAPIQRPDGVIQALSLIVDITDRKQAEQAARAADRRKDEFLAMLGHELRNPLAPILTALQLMALRGDKGAERERAIIERQARHLVRLVDDLLDVSRITRGKIELERAPTDLANVIAKAVEMASPLLERRSHRIELDVQPGLLVDGDPVRLAQVFQNLLTNAAKYTPPGGHIAVRGRRHGRDGVVEIQDDGIGIPAHLLPSVFEPFVQGERALDRSEGGLGIGLMLVRSLVELHGGSVTAHSEGAGKGSRFEVRLPLLRAGTAARITGAQPVLDARSVAGRRVLLVDDNADAAEMLAQVLRAVGHEVAVVHDGPSALAAAPAFAPEVALLDIGLPVMDGYELARHLRATLPRAPLFIALTGYGQQHDRQRSLEAGFADHLVKPVDPSRLIDAIARIQPHPGP